uniref:Gamma-tubulin complex component 6 n=1 Tax=Cuerna arida TaxID=1464854 RepID=A0A1B6GBQ4_9HEMI
MKTSTYNLVTELCSSVLKDVIEENFDKTDLVKQMRSYAFEILLNKRSVPLKDVVEDDPDMLLVDITGQIYWSAKSRGNWTRETNEAVKELMDKAQILVRRDQTVVPVLKLLLYLADSVPPTSENMQEPSYGLDMKTLITDHSLKHRSMIKSLPAFNTEMFEFPVSHRRPIINLSNPQAFSEVPGTGLKHKEFFTVPTLDGFSTSRIGLKDIDRYDLTNANWIFPKLQSSNSEDNKVSGFSIFCVPQDEGYVTPDQERGLAKEEESLYIPWEHMHEDKNRPVYSWESFGSIVTSKESPYLSQRPDAMDHMWTVIRAYNVSPASVPTAKKLLSLEELDRAFKNLLIGVESNVFLYSNPKKSFVLQEGLYLSGSDANTLEEYCRDFIECANYFHDLSILIEQSTQSTSCVIYQTLCSNIRHYLQCYRGIVLRMPPVRSFLQTHHWLQRLRSQLHFLVSLCSEESMPKGGALLAHLYDQVPLVSRTDLSFVLYYIIQSCCTIYFKFLKKWIFEGIGSDSSSKFFIESCPVSEMSFNRKFWTRNFILNRMLVPGFVKGLENDMLICGKSMALLRLCAPNEPVCTLQQQQKVCPEVECCLNSRHLLQVEAQCKQYRDRCDALCLQMFGDNSPNTGPDEDYFATVRAKSLEKIKQVQEEEKRLRTEKKRIEFDALKKNMEEAEARKVEDKKSKLEEEEKLLKEAIRLDQLNELRKEEEKEKLMQYYSAISEAADRRRERAEWKIKRAELHDKRIEFLKEKQEIEHFESNAMLEETEDEEVTGEQQDSGNELRKSSKQLRCVMFGSGDFSIPPDESSHKPVVKSELPLNLIVNGEQNETNHKFELKLTSVTKNQPSGANILEEENREWLIALDVADQARQAASRFKERNMFSDYNILTGEVTSYKDRFGLRNELEPNGSCEVKEHQKDELETNDVTVKTVNTDKNVEIVNVSCPKHIMDESRSVETTSNLPLERPTDDKSLSTSIVNPVCKDIPAQSEQNKNVFNVESKSELNVDEIDMTTLYQNLHMSVLFPLSTQLDLANKAVLRLFLNEHNLLKHLECIRKYMFLLEGEFSRNMTKSIFSELQVVQHPLGLLNMMRLNSILRLSIGTNTDEEFTDRLSFLVRENEIPLAFRLIDPRALDCLSLRYRTHWPLNIIITEEAIIKCDKVFTFLMQLQRTSWALEQDIYLLKDKRLADSWQFRQVQLYRHIMTHFVTTLKNYVTAVVLEESWFHFKEDFRKVKSLNDIYAAHVKYIKMLLFRCLLNKRSRTVNSNLVELLGVILTFHEILRSGEWTQDSATPTSQYTHSGFPRLSHQMDNFLRLSRFLYQYLDRLVGSGYQPHLVQLLTLLSANSFYSSV